MSNLIDIEAVRRGNQLRRAGCDIRNDVKPRAVRHRCCMQQMVADCGVVDIGQIVERHRQQVSVRQHDALRATGRAAGVKQPSGRLSGIGLRYLRRLGVQQLAIFRTLDIDKVGRASTFMLDGGDVDVIGDERDAHVGVVENERNFLRMQPHVDRNRASACCPARVQQFHIRGAVVSQ